MPNRLTENLDTNLVEAFAKLRSSDAVPRVQVYVEGYEDEAFWYSIVKEYEQQKKYKV